MKNWNKVYEKEGDKLPVNLKTGRKLFIFKKKFD
jgi:hypothetical protein